MTAVQKHSQAQMTTYEQEQIAKIKASNFELQEKYLEGKFVQQESLVEQLSSVLLQNQTLEDSIEEMERENDQLREKTREKQEKAGTCQIMQNSTIVNLQKELEETAHSIATLDAEIAQARVKRNKAVSDFEFEADVAFGKAVHDFQGRGERIRQLQSRRSKQTVRELIVTHNNDKIDDVAALLPMRKRVAELSAECVNAQTASDRLEARCMALATKATALNGQIQSKKSALAMEHTIISILKKQVEQNGATSHDEASSVIIDASCEAQERIATAMLYLSDRTRRSLSFLASVADLSADISDAEFALLTARCGEHDDFAAVTARNSLLRSNAAKFCELVGEILNSVDLRLAPLLGCTARFQSSAKQAEYDNMVFDRERKSKSRIDSYGDDNMGDAFSLLHSEDADLESTALANHPAAVSPHFVSWRIAPRMPAMACESD